MLIDCDFIPPQYHERRRLRLAIKRRSACVAGMFVMMLIWVANHQHQLSIANAMLTDVALQQSELGAIAQKKLELEQEQKSLIERRNLIEHLSDRASLVVVLADLTRCLPEDVVITELSVKTPLLQPYLVNPAAPRAAPAPKAATGAKTTSEKPLPPPPALLIEPQVLRIAGIAAAPSDVGEFSARVERSGLFADIYPDILEAVVWAGRRAHQFELGCKLIPHQKEQP